MIVYTSVCIIVFAIIYFLFNGKANKHAILLSIYLIVIALYPLTYYLTFFSKNDFFLAIFFNNFTPLYLLGGPSLYFYVKATLDDKIEWKPIHLLHLIPGIIYAINAGPYIFSSFENKLQTAALIHQNVENLKTIRYNWLFPNILTYVTRPIITSAYLIAAIVLFYNKTRTSFKNSKQNYLINRWLVILLTISVFFTALFILGAVVARENDINVTLEKIKYANALAGGAFLIIPITLLLFPRILYGLPNRIEEENNKEIIKDTSEKKSTDPSRRNHEAFKLLSKRVIEHIDEQKPYLQKNFNLTDLAAALDVPQHHISYCFNDYIDESFTALRARKRIEYVKELLLDGVAKNKSMDQIAEMAGFSSRSSFFSTFKEIAGMTPSEYIQRSKN